MKVHWQILLDQAPGSSSDLRGRLWGGGRLHCPEAQGSRALQVGQQISRVHSDVRKCTEDGVMAADFFFVVVVVSRSAHDHHLHQ